MKFLGIDTTGNNAKIVLLNGKNVFVDELKDGEKQSENLMTHIDDVFNKNRLSVGDMDAFGVVVGPGSFTGIRVGMATVKAFAFALDKPVVGVSVFEILAPAIKCGVCITKCTANSVYYGVIEGAVVKDCGVCEISKLDKFDGKKIFCLESEHLNLGDAYTFNVITNYNQLLVDAFADKLERKEFTKNVEPLYLQLSQAERNLERKND